jgi:mRNA interferase RelE/StbE
MMYAIRMDAPAGKFIDRADKKLAKRILDKIEELKQGPFPREATKVKGLHEEIYRIRVGKYRILYAVFQEKLLVVVVDIDKRGRIYE